MYFFISSSRLIIKRFTYKQQNDWSSACTSSTSKSPRSGVVAMMPQKPERVAVVGAGIGGLATAYALALTGAVKPEAIDVFEARTGPDTGSGGALNLTGGSGVLYHKFGIDLRPVSSPLSRVIGRSLYDSKKPAHHARLLFDFDVERAVMRQPSKRTLLLDSNGQSLFVTVMRDELQRVLLKETAGAGVNICMGCNIKAVLPDGVLQFSNHDRDHSSDNKEQEQYDLIIGADGVRSVVRDAVMSLLSTSSKSASSKSVYSGFRVLWGIDDSSCEDIENPPFGTIHQYFGNGLYLLHYGAGPRESRKRLMAASFQDSRARGENVNYRFNSEGALREEAGKLLLAAGFPQEIRRTFDMSQRFIDTPVYEYPTKKISCSVHRAVLVGDAGK